MGFPQRLLNDDEEVALDLRPHWSFFAKPASAVIVMLFLAIWITVSFDVEPLQVLAYLGLLAAAIWLGIRLTQWQTTHFVVTSDRLIFRNGVLSKHGIEIPLERVNNVIFNQTLLERMLRAGDLLIESAGESGQQRFSDVRQPDLVQNEIYRQMEANENRKYDRIADAATASSGSVSLSVPEQIDQLDDLRRRGVITDEEFERKKADLLDRM